MATCVAVIDKEGAPLLVECAAGDGSDEARRAAQLDMHFFVHSSLDIVDSKLAQPDATAGGARPSADLREPYLGQLIANDRFRSYGYATNTKIKFILVVELGNTTLKDQEIRAIFRRLHSVYCDTVSNPFYSPDQPLNSKSLVAVAREVLAH